MAPVANEGSALLVDKMKEAGLIDKAIFTFDLRLTTDSSFLFIGGYGDNKDEPDEKVRWLNSTEEHFWGFNLTMVRYGSTYS